MPRLQPPGRGRERGTGQGREGASGRRSCVVASAWAPTDIDPLLNHVIPLLLHSSHGQSHRLPSDSLTFSSFMQIVTSLRILVFLIAIVYDGIFSIPPSAVSSPSVLPSSPFLSFPSSLAPFPRALCVRSQ